MDTNTKIQKILDIYKELIKLKDKVLNENTYVGLVEIFMTNGYLEHASYFLCQMDRHKLKIPRNLLDLFLDYSVKNKIFEEAENNNYDMKNYENENKFNKYDQYDPKNDPDYVYYFAKRNLYKKRKDMKNLLSTLKVESKPFFPKTIENLDEKKLKLSDIDPSKIKEFIPRSYTIEKKE